MPLQPLKETCEPSNETPLRGDTLLSQMHHKSGYARQETALEQAMYYYNLYSLERGGVPVGLSYRSPAETGGTDIVFARGPISTMSNCSELQ
jgi:hypothetical protein